MKTITLTTPTHEIMLVELPQNAREPKLFNDKDRPYISYFQDIEIPRFYLPEGDWTALSFVSDLKESEVHRYVGKDYDYENFIYRDYSVNYPYYRHNFTALESFLSLLETKVMWDKKLKEPKYPECDCEDCSDEFEKKLSEWVDYLDNQTFGDAQSRTFDKARTIVLVKKIE